MKRKEIILIICIILCILFSFQAVSASDDLNTPDMVSISNNVSAYSLPNLDDQLQAGSDAGTFSELQNDLNGHDSVNLTKNYTFNSSSDPDELKNGIHITQSIIIDGKGKVIIDAKNMARVFDIADGATVTLKGITFINGNASNGNGGSIYSEGIITITDCIFINNTAVEHGGAIYIKHTSRSTIENCEFTGNIAGLNGGAIDWSAGSSHGAVINSTFTDNIAKRSGGAIHWSGHDGTIRDSTFINNNATGDVISEIGGVTGGGDGGAVLWVGSNGTVDNCTFDANFAQYRGGAIFLHGNSTENCTNTTVSNSNFVNNIAGLNGGAIDWQKGAQKGRLINSNFTNNTAWRSAGAVYWYGINGTISNCNFDDNHAIGNVTAHQHGAATYDTTGGNGGAIVWTGTIGYVGHSNFTNNTAASLGGAVYLQSNADRNCTNTTFDWCNFEDNVAGINGGAIDWHEGAHDGNVYNSTFTNNVAMSNGGAIFWSGHNGEIRDSNFTNNTAKGTVIDAQGNIGDGGAIIWSGINGTVTNCRFIDNVAIFNDTYDYGGRGGAVYLQNCTHGNCDNTTFNNCYFESNVAGSNGGAIDWHAGAQHGVVNNGTFINNTARRSGGAIFWNGHNGTVRYSKFYNNSALGIVETISVNGSLTYGGDGGAIMWSGAIGNVEKSNFVNNTAAKRGGAVFLQDSLVESCDNTTFKDSYFASNVAGLNGGAIDWHEGAHNGNIYNSTFRDNIAKSNGGAIFWSGHNGEIRDSKFINNTAKGEVMDEHGNIGDGGAVIWTGINGTVKNSSFIDNRAIFNDSYNYGGRGGAIFLQNCSHGNCENTSFTDVYFENNVAGTNGGAIDWHEGAHDGVISNATFINNTANRSGGAIFWNGHNGTIKYSKFYNNAALGLVEAISVGGTLTYGGDGGAVMWSGALGKVERSNFVNNTAAARGGAIFLQGSVSEDCYNTTLKHSYFANNVAGLNGGAIDWYEGAQNGVVENITFYNNTAKRSGGAIFWNGHNGTIRNSKFIDNRATGETLQYNMTLTMENVIVVNDKKLPTDTPSVSDVGKLYVLNYTNASNRVFESYVADDSTGTLVWLKLDETTTISQTISPKDWAIDQFFGGDGGTILWSGDVGTVENCTFIGSDSARRGGGAYMTGSDNVTFVNCYFENSTSGTNGGGVDWLAGARYGKIINTTFNNTRAARSAGAVYYDGWYGQMINITIINTKAWGGSLSESKDGRVKYAGWDSSHWDTNTTGGDAGAIMITGSHEYLYNITFTNCTAVGRGGAVFLQDNTNVTFDLCIFENNRALGTANNTYNNPRDTSSGHNVWKTGLGGAIGFDLGASNGTIMNSEFINNTAARDGGAISFAYGSSNATIYNSNFVNNTAIRSGGAFAWNGINGNISYCNFTSNSALGMAIDSDHVNLVSLSQVIHLDMLPVATAETTNKLYVLVTLDDDGNKVKYSLYVTVPDGNNGYEWLFHVDTNDTDPSPTDWAIDEYFGGDGGSILWGGDNGLIDNCIFIDSNSARRGGGAYMLGSDHVTVSNSYFENCTSGTNGGGLDWLAGANYGRVINSTFNNTRAARSAGAIYYDGDYGEMINITIINATAFGGALDNSSDGKVKYAGWDSSHWDTNTTGGDAGAIMFTGDNVYVYNATFINCTAAGRGGAVFLQDNDNITFEACTFEENSALGIANNTWKNYKEDRNDANPDTAVDYTLTGHGGAIAFDAGAREGIIINSTFNSNHAARDGGAAYYASGAADCKIINSTFTNHTINYDGGAIFINGTYCEIHNSTFINNTAKDDGGAIFWQGNNGIIYNITCDHNNGTGTGINGTSSTKGGVICLTASNVTVTKSTFTNSYGGLQGGTIFITGNDVNITDSVFKNSTIGIEDGGAIYILGNNTLIRNCTFDNCTAPNNGGVIYILGNNAILEQSVITNSAAIGVLPYYMSIDEFCVYDVNNTLKVIDSMISYLDTIKGGSISSDNITKLNNSLKALKTAVGNILNDEGLVNAANMTVALGLLNNLNQTLTEINGTLSAAESKKLDVLFKDVKTVENKLNEISNVSNSFSAPGKIINEIDSMIGNLSALSSAGISAANITTLNNILQSLKQAAENMLNGTEFNFTEITHVSELLSDLKETLLAINETATESQRDALKSLFGDIKDIEKELDIIYDTLETIEAPSVGGLGGAIYISGDGAVINTSKISYTTAYKGGGIYVAGDDVTVNNTDFSNINAIEDGGAIYVSGHGGKLYNSNFTNNTVTDDGGAIYWDGNNGIIYNITCINNNGTGTGIPRGTSSTKGGTIIITGNDTLLTKSHFENSYAGYIGGTIFITGNDVNVTDSTFKNSTVGVGDGGTIYILGNYTNIVNCVIEDSSSPQNGGAIYVEGHNATISAEFVNTNATVSGGSIYVRGLHATIVNSSFDNTHAFGSRDNGGGAIFISGDYADIESSNFTNNYANNNHEARGGAIYISGLNTTITDSNFEHSRSNLYGGAIYINGTNTTVKTSNFTDCEVDSDVSQGGSIYVNGEHALIEGSNFADSYAKLNGGSIYINGNYTTVRDSDFTDSKVDAIGSQGGSIYVSGEYAVIEGSSFAGSYAELDGGSIYINGNYTTVSNSTFNGSKVDDAESEGGSIYVFGEYAVIEGSSFAGSSAEMRGGAIYIRGNDTTVSNSSFTGSMVDADGSQGGAIYVNGTRTVIEGSSFVDSYAKLNGGAIYVEGNYTTITHSDFLRSKVDDSDARGGAIYLEGNHTNVTYSSFNNSFSAKFGGAIYSIGSYSTVYGSNFTNNIADYDGGGIYWYGGTNSMNNTVDGCIFTGNIAYAKGKVVKDPPAGTDPRTTLGGGGIYWSELGSYGTVKNSKFYNNSVQSDKKADGGAILWDNCYNALIDNCTFVGNYINTTSNKANDNDGAEIWVQGGAIYARSHGNYTIRNCLFENCSSSKEAGALYIQTGTKYNHNNYDLSFKVENVKFVNNIAECIGPHSYGAGAVQVKQYKYVEFRNVTFINNTAKLSGGALMTLHTGQDFNMYDCKFINNTAKVNGGAISAEKALKMYDTSFYNNTANEKGGGLYTTLAITNNNLNFTGNKAFKGSAIYSTADFTLNNAVLLKNRANTSSFVVDDANGIITIDFQGWDNYLNGIFMDNSKTLKVKNVKYWNENGEANTGSSEQTLPGNPAVPTNESGQNFTIEIGNADGIQLNKKNCTFLTDANGHISVKKADILDEGASIGAVEYVDVYLTNQDYYTYVEKFTRKYPSFKASTTNATFHLNGTVSMELPQEAKSNVSVYIYDQFMGNITLEQGKGTINVSTLVNGKYLEVGSHTVVLKYAGDGQYRPFETTTVLNVTKAESRIILNVTTHYYDFVINVTVEHNDTGIVTDPNDVTGNVTLNVRGQIINVELVNGTGMGIAYNMPPGAIRIEAAYSGDDNYKPSSNFTYENITERIRTLVEIKVSAEDIMVDETIYINVTIISNQTVEGIITVILDNVEYNLTLNNSMASFNKTGLTAGKKYVVAMFAGNETLAPSTGYAPFNVHKYDADVLIDAKNITHGSEEDIVIAVPQDAVGIVNVTINGTEFKYKHILEIINGTVKIPLQNLDVDVYNITVLFEDAKYKFTSNSTLFKVSKLKPPVIIQADNVTYGNDTIILVEVQGAVGGNVTLKINDTLKVYENVTLDNGTASFTVRLPVGDYVIDVVYSGDESDEGNTGQSKFEVYKANPKIDIQVADILFGKTEKLNITVNAAGNVTIKLDGVIIAENEALDANNKTSKSLTGLRTGTHTIEVIHSGNDNFNSASNTAEFEVLTMDTKLYIAAGNIFVWDTTDIHVRVLDNGGYLIRSAPGNVTININGIDYSSKIVDGIATFNIDNLTVGHKVLWAFYGGDGDLNPSKAMGGFEVKQRTPDVSVTAINVTTLENGKLTINVPANANGYVIVSGNFTNYQIRVDSFNNGVAEIPLEKLANGTYSVHIKYYGEAYDNYTTAEDDCIFKVSKANVTLSIVADDIVYGENASITVTVPDGVEGSITLKLNDTASSEITLTIVNNKVTWIVESLAAGNYTVNVTYNGNNYYNINNTESKNFEVKKVNSVISIDTPVSVDAATNATIIVRINETATGNITLTLNGTEYNATIVNGVATFVINQLLSGTYDIIANYTGDNNNTNATFTLSNALTITKVVCYQINVTANDTLVGLNSTIVVKVPADAEGNVSVYVDTIFVGNATISQGIAKLNVTAPYGNHTVNVTFTDGKYGPRYAICDFWVFKHETPLIIDVVSQNIKVGDNVTVTVTLPTDIKNEDITLEINGITLTNKSDSNVVTFVIPSVTNGGKTITVTYNGNDKYLFNSTTDTFTVTKRESFVNVTATDNSVGGNATISVEIPANATGYVVVNVNGTNYTINTTGGLGSVNISGLGNGTYYVYATYLGDDQYKPSENNTETFEMSKVPPVITINVGNVPYGNPTIIEIIIPDATGNLTIKINDTDKGEFTLVNGKVVFDAGVLAVENYTVHVYYKGDAKYGAGTADKDFNVTKATPAITIVDSLTDANTNATIYVRISSDASGTLNITVGGKNYTADIIGGVARFTVDKLPVNLYDIIANYTGDANYTSKNATLVNGLNVTKDNSYLMNVTAVDVGVGENTTIVVNVPVDATGTVTVWVNGTKLTNATHGGKAIFYINQTKEGRYVVNATLEDVKYANQTVETTYYVSRVDIPIEITVVNKDSIYVGDTVKVIVTVPEDVTESVTIEINGIELTNVTVSGIATFYVPAITYGNKTVVAAYVGDDKYVSNSTTANFTVNKRNSYVNVTVENITVGDIADIEVKVPANATGYVVVVVNGVNYTANLTGGIGHVHIKDLANGTYNVNVTYIGDDQYLSSINGTKLGVTKSNTTLTINVVDIIYGDIARINVTVDPNDATGFITLRLNNTQFITLPIVNNMVEWNVSGLAAGTYMVWANYSGDGKYNINNTNKVNKTFKVNKVNSVLNIINPVSVDAATNATIIVTINETATGNITIIVNGTEYNATIVNGVATFVIDKLVAGAYDITADYIGDDNNTAAATVHNTLTVTKVSCYQINVSANDTYVGLNTTVIVNVPDDARGNVSIYIDGVFEGNATISNGVAKLNVTRPYGNYTVNATFSDAKYGDRYATADFWVFKYESPLTIAVDSILVGQTAYINVTAPSNNVTIEINGKSYNAERYASGTAYFEVSDLVVGNKTVVAIYGGSNKYLANATTENFTVSKCTLDVIVTVTPTINVGDNATVSVELLSNATGYVVVNVGGNNYTINLTLGKGSVEISGLRNTTYNVNVTYLGDDNYLSRINNTQSIKVNKVASSINLTVSEDGIIAYGNNLNITIDVPVDATGKVNVSIYKGVEIIKSYIVFVNEGKGFLHIDNPDLGLYEVYGEYLGDDKYLGNTNRTSYEVYATGGVLGVLVENIYVNQSQNITVVIPGRYNGEMTIIVSNASGEIFKQNATITPNDTLSSANVTLPKLLHAGAYDVFAYYIEINGSKVTVHEGTGSFNVDKLPSQIKIESINATIFVGENETIVLSIDLDSRAADANISVFVNDVEYKTDTSNLTLEIAGLNASHYKVNVVFHGNDWYLESNATASFDVVKNPAPMDIKVTNSTVGEIEQINVTLPDNASGQVLLDINGQHYYANVTSGLAQFNITGLEAGEYDFNVTYVGDYKFFANNTRSKLKVSKLQPAFIVNGTNITVGDEELIKFETSENITSEVIVEINGVNYTSFIKEGEGNLTVNGLLPGDYNVTVYFAGNARYMNASAKNNFTVNKTSVGIELSVMNITYLDNETVVVYVNAVGNVTLRIGANVIDTKDLVGGKATFTVTDLAAGTYTANATFNGNVNLTSVSAEADFTVAKATPQLSVIVSNIIYYSVENIIVNVNVGGNVTIKVNGTVKGRELEINSNKVELPVYDLAAGTYPVEVIYNGNENYTSLSVNDVFVVYQAPISIDVELLSSIDVGVVQVVNITVSNVNATGDVLINVDGVNYTKTLKNGFAQINLTEAYGNHTVTVYYPGDRNFTSNITIKTFEVERLASELTINVSDIYVSQKETIKVNVTTGATGKVLISVGGKNYTVTIESGFATLELDNLANGSYPVYARYLGDENYNECEGNALFNVNKVQSSINLTVSHLGIVANGTDVNITIKAPIDATGKVNVTINDGLQNISYIVYVNDGTGMLHLETPAIGIYNVTAVYLGDGKYIGSENKTEFEVYPTALNLYVGTQPLIFVNDTESISVMVSGNHKGDQVEILVTDSQGNILINRNETFTSYSGSPFNATSVVLNLGHFDAGEYLVEAIYIEINGTKKIEHTGSNTFVVSKLPTQLTIKEIANITVGENITIELEFGPVEATGNISVFVNGVEHIVNSSNLTIVIPGLDAEEYHVHAVYYGDKNYLVSNASAEFKVSKNPIPMDIVVTNSYVGGVEQITVILLNDATGRILLDVGDSHYYADVENGNATFNIYRLDAGKYSFNVTYEGDDKYFTNKSNSSFIVSKYQPEFVVNGTNITFGSDELIKFETQYNITGLVKVEINGVNYTSFIEEGKGNLTLYDLAAGDYNITLYFNGNEKYLNATAENKFTVNKSGVAIELSVMNITYLDSETVVVYVDAIGNVTLRLGTTVIDTKNLENGKATFVIDDLVAGNYTAYATYNGNDNLTSVSGEANFTVFKADPIIKLEVQNISYGDVEHIIIRVNAEGNVTVKVNGTEHTIVLKTDDSGVVILRAGPTQTYDGKAHVYLYNLLAGEYPVEVTFNGNDNYNTATANDVFYVNKANSTIKVDVEDITEGDVAVINITLPENATGNVTVTINNIAQTVELIKGNASVRFDNLAPGNKTVVVEYSGDGNYVSNYTLSNFTVEKAKVVPDLNVIDLGNGTVAVVVGDNATGNVTITVDGKNFTAEVINGTAYVNVDDVTPGVHDVNVTYSGDATHNATAKDSTIDVPKYDTPIKVEIGNITEGGSGIVTVTVPNNATGNVTVYVGGKNVTVEVHDGVATVEIGNLTAGNQTIVVRYSGDDNYVPNEVISNITVEKAKVVPDLNVIDLGNGTVAVVVGDNATGNVTITVDGKNFTAEVINGTAYVNVDDVTPGVHDIEVIYSGDDTHNSTSTTSVIDVPKYDTPINVEIGNITEGGSGIVTVTVPDGATGNVTVYVGGKEITTEVKDGVATVEIGNLTAGNHTVVVRYSGDDNYAPNEVISNVTVEKAMIVPDLTVVDLGNGTVAVIVGDNATGNVTITIDGKNFTAEVVNGTA
ncbi:Ig-like domain repeat protein, partial [Methanobrevibacter millerae]